MPNALIVQRAFFLASFKAIREGSEISWSFLVIERLTIRYAMLPHTYLLG